MDHETFITRIAEQAEAMQQAAVAAGPAAKVPTCPEWTVKDLVAHIAAVHNMAAEALTRSIDERPARVPVPDDWDELLAWWAGQRTTLVTRLTENDPAKQVWGFIPELATVGWWARRQAHETAIHRLDAEHARAESVPTLLFDSEMAADGIDEVLMISEFRARMKRPEVTVTGTVLLHAADAGKAWIVRAEEGAVTSGPVEDSATDADASLVGTADAVFRAAWKRPSTAIAGGRVELLQALNGG
ncbi:MAG: maleylpyruvate isomerase family mycothiol-dependent enzyme [Kibdelosporangium sp.]